MSKRSSAAKSFRYASSPATAFRAESSTNRRWRSNAHESPNVAAKAAVQSRAVHRGLREPQPLPAPHDARQLLRQVFLRDPHRLVLLDQRVQEVDVLAGRPPGQERRIGAAVRQEDVPRLALGERQGLI